ncbi:LOW QUALITY PROTEIN: H-2 class II histocompatibility antigen, A-U alpha chain-like [Nerophis ophidion]|uniref:LOW QUALITY PROTEIN: H-2 class II histocompatibility antigen, A-U alpha chain-like n=1 Tax=Nerophis ophidion TaxID=159077 RepID=UPI002AE0856F|nr:LOW QUALITY PROTEIN: H-2 class II histocompatibility antigen, A-U alpha chain-like [Nerophis ophidion]
MKASVLQPLLSGISADDVHEDLHIVGCSDTDGEAVYSLDGEVLWYADFARRAAVEPQPDFIHMCYTKYVLQGALLLMANCKTNLNTTRNYLKDDPLVSEAPSDVIVYSRDEVLLGEKNTLICHGTGLYPAPVTVRWAKNGEHAGQEGNTSPPFPNKDGSFQQTSRLDFTPQKRDIYSCIVEHKALEEPNTHFWGVKVMTPGIGPAVFCGLGLTVGLLCVATGTFFIVKGNQCS